MSEVEISRVVVGDRFRRDFGDIESLAQSIEQIGLLQPIGIDSENRLVFGERRLRAFRLLGRETIPARVVDLDQLILGEFAENELRKDFTPSERVAIGAAIEERLGNRQGQRTDLGLVDNSPQVQGEKTRDLAAKQAGFGSEYTYRQAKAVTETGAPELIDAMDAGKVSISAAADIATLPKEEQTEIVARGKKEILEAAKEIRSQMAEEKKEVRRRDIAAQREAIETGSVQLPGGVFEIVVMDPPWHYGRVDNYDPENWRVANPYPEMTRGELLALQPPFADEGLLFLWTTHKFIWDAKDLMDYWGFNYKATIVWDKESIGMGRWLRMQCEFCLVGVRGAPTWDNTTWRDIIREPRREHSRKPEKFYEMVESITVGRRLDYFSRESRKGWAQFGNDSGKFNELAG